MLKHSLTAAALATVLAVPAYAQSMNNAPAHQPPTSAQSAPSAPAEKTAPPMKDNSSSAMPAKPDKSAAADTNAGTKQAGFVQQQDSSEWRSSKLVGASVYGPDNKSIGSIDDLILDQKGAIKAAVIGVGGFLGVGEHLVAVAFDQIKFVDEPIAYTGASNASPNRPASTTTTGAATTNAPPASSKSKSNPWYPDHAVFNATKDQLKQMPEFKYST